MHIWYLVQLEIEALNYLPRRAVATRMDDGITAMNIDNKLMVFDE